jgi:hypothetical protein
VTADSQPVVGHYAGKVLTGDYPEEANREGIAVSSRKTPCLFRRPGTSPTVRGTVVVNNIHVSNTNMRFELPTPLLWRLPRGGLCCAPPPLSPRSSTVQRGNGSNNNEGHSMPHPWTRRPMPLLSLLSSTTTTRTVPSRIPRPSVGRRLRSAPSARANKDDQ